MAPATLFSPLNPEPCRLSHRVVMAPLTRMRAAGPGNLPHPLNRTWTMPPSRPCARWLSTSAGAPTCRATRPACCARRLPVTQRVDGNKGVHMLLAKDKL